jgi:hypothetical protein
MAMGMSSCCLARARESEYYDLGTQSTMIIVPVVLVYVVLVLDLVRVLVLDLVRVLVLDLVRVQ